MKFTLVSAQFLKGVADIMPDAGLPPGVVQ
jgi:hypothetical protein